MQAHAASHCTPLFPAQTLLAVHNVISLYGASSRAHSSAGALPMGAFSCLFVQGHGAGYTRTATLQSFCVAVLCKVSLSDVDGCWQLCPKVGGHNQG